MADVAQRGAEAGERARGRAKIGAPPRSSGGWAGVWRRFSRQRAAVIAAVLLAALVLVATLAPFIAPDDPTRQFRDIGVSAMGQPLPPNARFWLGTDSLGRDLLSRLIFGVRTSITIGFVGASGAMILAVLVGGAGGFAGGTADFVLMRFVDLVMSVPTFFLMLLLVVMLKPGVWVVILVIATFSWAYPARVFRSQVLSIRRREFIQAAESVGVPARFIFVRHVLPHLLPTVLIYFTLMVPSAVFAEAGLSFVGLGVPPPNPSLGSMISDGQQYYQAAPWIILYPGLALATLVVSFNIVGTALRDALDPQRRGR